MAPPTRRLVYILRRWNTGWVRVEGSSLEKYTVYADLSDRSQISTSEEMYYAKGEREGIIERAVTGRGTAADWERVQRIQRGRAVKAQDCHSFIDRNFANGTKAT